MVKILQVTCCLHDYVVRATVQTRQVSGFNELITLLLLLLLLFIYVIAIVTLIDILIFHYINNIIVYKCNFNT